MVMLTRDRGEDELELEEKGGKPSTGTPKDGRLKENQGDSGSSAKPSKPAPFPGAAKPFKKS